MTRSLHHAGIAPVDLPQVAIGFGMAIFTRYHAVIDTDGHALTVREALVLINQVLHEMLAEQVGDVDAETTWAMAWFESNGFRDGPYGAAETLAKAKNVSLDRMATAGLLVARQGTVRLLRPAEGLAGQPVTVWGMVHRLIHALDQGEAHAAAVLAALEAPTESVPTLAAYCYALCERTRRAAEARQYNTLVQSWPEIARLAGQFREEL